MFNKGILNTETSEKTSQGVVLSLALDNSGAAHRRIEQGGEVRIEYRALFNHLNKQDIAQSITDLYNHDSLDTVLGGFA